MAKANKQLSTFDRMVAFLGANYCFKYNIVLKTTEYALRKDKKFIEMNYFKLNNVYLQLLARHIKVSKQDVLSYINSDFTEQYDPFKDYFDGLPRWAPDHEDYILKLAETIKVKSDDIEIRNLYIKRWLIALVGCAISSNIVNQQVFVLIGSQGIGKTKWIESLLPNELKSYYYSGNIVPGNKDSKVKLAQSLIINLDELGNLNRGDLATLKQTITLSTIRERLPYAVLPEKMIRRASFIGSVNETEFLRDDTGNRRFLCLEADSIEYLHQVPINWVYAQAHHLYCNSEKYWFDGEEIIAINERNKQFKIQFPELEYILLLFRPCTGSERPDLLLSAAELAEYLKERFPRLYMNAVKLGKIMKAGGFIKTKNGGVTRFRLKHNKE